MPKQQNTQNTQITTRGSSGQLQKAEDGTRVIEVNDRY